MKELAFSLYFIYTAINLYTDSKSLETYNRLHLFTGILLTIVYFLQDYSIQKYIIIVFVALVIGIIAENLSITKMGPGDTKMLIVSSIFLALFTPIKTWAIPLLLFFGYKIIVAVIVVTYCLVSLLYHLIRDKQLQSEYLFKKGNYSVGVNLHKSKLPQIIIGIPAAGGILLSTMILLILCYSY